MTSLSCFKIWHKSDQNLLLELQRSYNIKHSTSIRSYQGRGGFPENSSLREIVRKRSPKKRTLYGLGQSGWRKVFYFIEIRKNIHPWFNPSSREGGSESRILRKASIPRSMYVCCKCQIGTDWAKNPPKRPVASHKNNRSVSIESLYRQHLLKVPQVSPGHRFNGKKVFTPFYQNSNRPLAIYSHYASKFRPGNFLCKR